MVLILLVTRALGTHPGTRALLWPGPPEPHLPTPLRAGLQAQDRERLRTLAAHLGSSRGNLHLHHHQDADPRTPSAPGCVLSELRHQSSLRRLPVLREAERPQGTECCALSLTPGPNGECTFVGSRLWPRMHFLKTPGGVKSSPGVSGEAHPSLLYPFPPLTPTAQNALPARSVSLPSIASQLPIFGGLILRDERGLRRWPGPF